MNLLIESEIDRSTGDKTANCVCILTTPTGSLKVGDNTLDLTFFISIAQKNLNRQSITPVILDEESKIKFGVGWCVINLTQDDLTGANLFLTVHNKVKTKLESDYSWQITVQ